MYISQTHFGFTILGSDKHNFWIKALWSCKFWSGTPCTSRESMHYNLFSFRRTKNCTFLLFSWLLTNSLSTALHLAAFYGNTNVAEVLVEANAFTHIKNVAQQTAYDLALAIGHNGVATYLSSGKAIIWKVTMSKSKIHFPFRSHYDNSGTGIL